jgi:sensor domain CHASE-containing protein
MGERENQLKNEYRGLERDKDRLSKELQSIKTSLKLKEISVKQDIEKVWNEWQDKYDAIEQENNETKLRVN